MSAAIASPPGRETPQDATWLTLLRTIRAPLSMLLLGGIGLLVPPQTADMLAALEDGRASIRHIILFHVALAFLAFSAWYWSRALVAARYDVPDNETARDRAFDHSALRNAYDFLPRAMYVLAVLMGLGIVIRSGAWANIGYLALWAIPLGLAVYFRTRLTRHLFACLHLTRHGDREESPGKGMPKKDIADLCEWVRSLIPRLKLLIRRAPWPNWFSALLIAVSLAIFVWGALDSFYPRADGHRGLPAWGAYIFPGPAVALVAMALIIAPLSVLTFLFDGLDVSFCLFGLRLLRRPPVVLALLAWVLIAPTLFSLHTVRIVEPTATTLSPNDRKDLSDFFADWVKHCAPPTGPVRPVIVAVSGGASRAAIWGERVLTAVEEAAQQGDARVFAVSSVSGGSLGVAAYMAALAGLDNSNRCSGNVRRQMLGVLKNHQLSEDALGPLLAGALLVDIPRALLSPIPQVVRWVTRYGDPRGGDRAEALERAFESLWQAVPPGDYQNDANERPMAFSKQYLSLFYLQKTSDGQPAIRPGMPLWIANGTDADTGGRLVTAPFSSRTMPLLGAVDVLASLGADVPISTAINNTARFPYLEPSGELLPFVPHNEKQLPQLDRRRQPDGTAREIIDGGYFDNEGLQTALDLADWLEREGSKLIKRAVEPIIVQATGDGDVLPSEDVVRCEPRHADAMEVATSRRPLQLLAPVSGLYNVRGGHIAIELQEARAAFCPDDTKPYYECDTPSGLPVRCTALDPRRQRFFHFYLPAQGATPVPLNWVLSDSTARYIWDGAMQAGGNPREERLMQRALRTQ